MDSLRSVSSELAWCIIQNVHYLVPVFEIRAPLQKILAKHLDWAVVRDRERSYASVIPAIRRS